MYIELGYQTKKYSKIELFINFSWYYKEQCKDIVRYSYDYREYLETKYPSKSWTFMVNPWRFGFYVSYNFSWHDPPLESFNEFLARTTKDKQEKLHD